MNAVKCQCPPWQVPSLLCNSGSQEVELDSLGQALASLFGFGGFAWSVARMLLCHDPSAGVSALCLSVSSLLFCLAERNACSES